MGKHNLPAKEKILNGIVVDENGCWVWQGAHAVGYGKVWMKGKSHSTHKVAYIEWIGPVPEGKDVGHKCHDEAVEKGLCDGGECSHRLCCNPDHLKAETRSENLNASGLFRKKKRKDVDNLWKT